MYKISVFMIICLFLSGCATTESLKKDSDGSLTTTVHLPIDKVYEIVMNVAAENNLLLVYNDPNKKEFKFESGHYWTGTNLCSGNLLGVFLSERGEGKTRIDIIEKWVLGIQIFGCRNMGPAYIRRVEAKVYDLRFGRKKEKPKEESVYIGTGWPTVSGYVVTNNHVVEGKKKITLIRPDGLKVTANVLLGDKVNDIALLKVSNTNELPPACPLAETTSRIGAKVFTLGYPHPDLLGTKSKLTEGIISSVTGFQDDPRTYQITVPLQAGNSGGPLINLNGEVVGIVTSKLNAIEVFKWSGDLPQNVNYAIKIQYLKVLLESVREQSTRIKELPRNPGSVEELAALIENSIMIVIAE